MVLPTLDKQLKFTLVLLKAWNQILIVSKCMLGVVRPSFEVVKEGRILHFVSGDRRFIFHF
jgi:hypothetical protein